MSIVADELRWKLAQSNRKRLQEYGYVPILAYGEVGHELYKHTGTGFIIEVKTIVKRRTEQDEQTMFDTAM